MIKKVRCPRCNRRLFDVTDKTVGPITSQCSCKDKVLVRYYTFERIVFKSKQFD